MFFINISCGYYVNMAENHMLLVVVKIFRKCFSHHELI